MSDTTKHQNEELARRIAEKIANDVCNLVPSRIEQFIPLILAELPAPMDAEAMRQAARNWRNTHREPGLCFRWDDNSAADFALSLTLPAPSAPDSHSYKVCEKCDSVIGNHKRECPSWDAYMR